MIYAGNISGNKPHMRKYNVNGGAECIAGAAIQSNEITDNTSGCIPQTVELCIGCLGVAQANAVSIAAQNGDEGPFGILEDLAQELQFLLDQEARRARAQVLGDALGRGVGAVRGAEGVVDVDLGQRGELL